MLVLISILLILFIIVFEVKRKKLYKIDFLTIFNLFFVVYYPISFIFIKIEDLYFNNNSDLELEFKVVIAFIMGYLSLILGFNSKKADLLGNNIKITPNKSYNFYIITGIGLVLLSVISIFIYSSQYGGISNAISYASAIRGGFVEGGSLVFFKRFILASQYASFILAAILFFNKKQKRDVLLYFIFIISVIVTIFGFLISASRGNIILYVLIFFLVFTIKYKKIKISNVLPLAIMTPFILAIGDALFLSLRSLNTSQSSFISTLIQNLTINSNDSPIEMKIFNLMHNFQHRIDSLKAAIINTGYYDYRLFSDWIYGFLSYLPERLINISVPETIAYLNTYYLIGQFKSTIPPGIIALNYYSLGWIGIVVGSFLTGILGRFIQSLLQNGLRNNQDTWFIFFYILVGYAWGSGIQSGEPRVFFQQFFLLFVIFIYLILFGSKLQISRHYTKYKS